MDKNKIGLELVKNAVVALEAQKGFYVEAVKSHEVKDIGEILRHRGQYAEWFDDKKTIKTEILVNEIIILEGKSGEDFYKRGQRLAYIEQFKKYKEIGYDTMQDFIKDLPFAYSTARLAIYAAKNFDRDMCILHKSKLNLIPAYLLDEMTDSELRKLLTDIIDKSYSETQEYIRNYKRSRGGESQRRHDEPEDENVIHTTQRVKNESGRVQYITIDIKPRIKVDGQHLQFGFANKLESEIYTLAYRRSQSRIHSIISSEISKMLQEEEYQNYVKKLLKK